MNACGHCFHLECLPPFLKSHDTTHLKCLVCSKVSGHIGGSPEPIKMDNFNQDSSGRSGSPDGITISDASALRRKQIRQKRQQLLGTRAVAGSALSNNSNIVTYSSENSLSRTRARDAFQAIVEMEKSGYVCFIEKCYVLLGGRPGEEALLFAALQRLVNSEKEEHTLLKRKISSQHKAFPQSGNTTPESAINVQTSNSQTSMVTTNFEMVNEVEQVLSWDESNEKRRQPINPNLFTASVTEESNSKVSAMVWGTDTIEKSNCNMITSNINHRHKILKDIQTMARLSPKQTKVQYPRDEFSHVFGIKKKQFDVSLPMKNSLPVVLPLPLPQISGEWGFAKLFLGIGVEKLIIILKLMLLERSVLVLGQSYEEVTSCTCALLELLRPYTWPSTFLPLLPRAMLDFVNSPVPFVVGMICDGTNDLKGIESDHRVTEAIEDGMSVLNLSEWSLRITNDDSILRLLNTPPHLRSILESLRQRLDDLVSKEFRLLHDPLSFGTFLENGFGRRATLTIASSRRAIFSFMKDLAGDVAKQRGLWRRYGVYEDSSGFEFYPSLLIDQFRSELLFREELVRTQMFVGFVDSMRKSDLDVIKSGADENIVDEYKGEEGQLISKWVYNNMCQRIQKD
uniref:UDENN domain-containing protein n=1 Tax=Proboscia inermis TaxID=420281 RepID=A0A7S0GHK8_9STRA